MQMRNCVRMMTTLAVPLGMKFTWFVIVTAVARCSNSMQVRNPMPVMACCTILLPVVLLRFERVVVKALVVVQVKVCKVMAMRPCSICIVVELIGFVLVPVDVGD